RACHRPSQGRAPHGTQLSLVQARRCQQRRACRRRLQLPPSPPLAQALVAPNPGRTLRPAAAQSDLKTGIFTVDDFYSSPTLNVDGSRLAWLSWQHPNMPWTSTYLNVAGLDQ